jgi:F-type H+-transporting ATPase subunit alpha
VAIIYLGTKGLLAKVPVNKVRQFEQQFLTMMRNAHADTLEALKRGEYNDKLTAVLEKVAADLVKSFNN